MKEYTPLTGLPLNPLFIFTISIYTFIFFTGLVNLVIFLIRKIQGKSILTIQRPIQKIPLDKEKSVKLICWLFSLLFLTYLLPGLFLAISQIKPIYLILGANLLLQIGSIFVVLKYVNFSFFNLSATKNEFNSVLTIYTAIVPIIIISLLINLFLLEFFGIKPTPSPIEEIASLIDTRFALFLFSFQAVLVAPLAEEFIFRGVFYKLLRKRYSFFLAALALSLFFALLHRSPAGTLSLFVISFAICYVYEKTQKLSAAFILHALHNLITLLFFLSAL